MSDAIKTDEQVSAESPTLPADSVRPTGGLWGEVRPLLLRIHFYAGLYIAPFIVVAAITGLLFVVSIPVERAVFRDLNEVEPIGAALSLEEQINGAQEAVPTGEVARVRLAEGPERTTRVEFVAPESVDYRTAFVNPYNGEVLGVQTTNSHYMAYRTWLETFHSTLQLGEWASLYSELAASWLWIIALVGALLWLTQARKRRRLRSTLLPTTSGSSRVKLRSWHATMGLVAILGIFAISATGLTWSVYAGGNLSELREAMDWREREINTALSPSSELSADQRPAAFDRVLATARADGLDGPVVIRAGEAAEAWVVGQDKVTWPMKQDKVAVDPVAGQVVDRLAFDDYPLMAKLATWGIWLHMGVLFGWLNQLGLIVVVSIVLWLILSGYRMWWRRRPTRGVAGPPTVQRPTARACAVVLALALVIGWALPVLGISLLLFLAWDLILATARGRRTTASSA